MWALGIVQGRSSDRSIHLAGSVGWVCKELNLEGGLGRNLKNDEKISRFTNLRFEYIGLVGNGESETNMLNTSMAIIGLLL